MAAKKKTPTRRLELPPGGVEFDVAELADPEMPIDTIGGIMQTIQKTRSPGRPGQQCSSTHCTGKRSISISFCTLREGHDGDHSNGRKKWPNTKKAKSA